MRNCGKYSECRVAGHATPRAIHKNMGERMMRKPVITILLASSSLLGLLCPLAAQAQAADEPVAQAAPEAADAPQAEEQEILVTGSRVARTGMDAPTPRTVIGS